ncbi:hypothetical protein SPI_01510 [Niveomyces insectorum RCEF 264]|uniref:Uncharacterized protein n=1 Tax=Niveomyces insectorum RCEF 264 TaxID=1081102 RepID=A0A167Z0R8_9HYPO|nr:hypothetical protein SPI_01510 [Niveomyces insectorum RCEF 264]
MSSSSSLSNKVKGWLRNKRAPARSAACMPMALDDKAISHPPTSEERVGGFDPDVDTIKLTHNVFLPQKYSAMIAELADAIAAADAQVQTATDRATTVTSHSGDIAPVMQKLAAAAAAAACCSTACTDALRALAEGKKETEKSRSRQHLIDSYAISIVATAACLSATESVNAATKLVSHQKTLASSPADLTTAVMMGIAASTAAASSMGVFCAMLREASGAECLQSIPPEAGTQARSKQMALGVALVHNDASKKHKISIRGPAAESYALALVRSSIPTTGEKQRVIAIATVILPPGETCQATLCLTPEDESASQKNNPQYKQQAWVSGSAGTRSELNFISGGYGALDLLYAVYAAIRRYNV